MANKKNMKFKSLMKQRGALDVKLKELNNQQNLLQQEKKLLKQQILKLEENIDKIREKDLTVSDHAVVRYLERIEGLKVQDIKEKIKASIEEYVNTLGNTGKFPIGDGAQAIVEDNVVVTIVN
jgi:predicted transcriptional regulator